MKTRSLYGSLWIGCSMICATLMFASVSKADNLITNPGFESNSEGWYLHIPRESEGKVEPFQTAGQTDAHSGTACAMIKVSNAARFGLCPKKPIAVKPGERYCLSVWVRFSEDASFKAGAAGAFIRAALWQDIGKDIADPMKHMHIGLQGTMVRSPRLLKLATTEVPRQWFKLEGVVEIPADTAYISPGLYVDGVDGTVFWDDLSVELVSNDTPLTREDR